MSRSFNDGSIMSGIVTTARRVPAGIVIALAVMACEKTSSTEPLLTDHQHLTATTGSKVDIAGNALVADVHSATARFHSTRQASEAGYVGDPHCVEHPTLGGMGHHWVNQGLVDPVFDATSPEALVYAPDKHGKLRLIALEYIVINTGQTAPMFAGQPFDVGGSPVPVAHWTLHVWTHKANPSGLFAPFNPDVDCP